MRLLVADQIDIQPLEELKILGVELVNQPDLSRDDLPKALEGVGILVVRATEVTSQAIDAARELSLIVRAGVGVGNIDVAAASARGVYVANCPGVNAAAVSELTMGLILSLDRQLVDATVGLRNGKWDRTAYSHANGLMGRRIGIVGMGAIGREVLSRARAFGLVPHAYSRTLSAAKAARLGVGYASSLEQLAARSDILTLHLPLTPQTAKIVDRDVLKALPDEAILVNTARAGLIDYDALAELIPQKSLRFGLDVHPDEPDEMEGTYDPRLMNLGSVYGTPHVAAWTRQANRAVAHATADCVRSFLTEEDVPNVVNICASSPARFVVVLRMADKVGALANTLAVIKRHGINIEEISNTVFDGAQAACTKMRVTGRPSEACLKEIRAFDEVLHVDIVSMPNLA